MNIFDLMRKILDTNKDIEEMNFHVFPPFSLLQDVYELDNIEKDQINSALTIRKETGIPFWDSLMLTFFNHEKHSERFFSWCQRHNKNGLLLSSRNISEIESVVKANPKQMWALSSRLSMANTSKHLLFIDFHIRPNDDNLQIVEQLINSLGVKGYILNSGESYHFISKSVHNQEEWLDFTAKLLFFSPIVDRAWIAHQLLERTSSLRISLKHNITPFLNKELI